MTMHLQGLLSRRSFTAVALAFVACPARAVDLTSDVAAAVDRILAGRKAAGSGIRLTAPETAENGAQVPVTLGVEGAMTRERHVTALHLVATRNPTPGVARFELSPASGIAAVTTRIRLAEGQQLLAFAEWSDGTVWSTSVDVKVSVGGCLT